MFKSRNISFLLILQVTLLGEVRWQPPSCLPDSTMGIGFGQWPPAPASCT